MRHFLAILVITLSISTIACGKKEKPKAPQATPCAVGVNQTDCKSEINGTSRWVRSYNVTSQDPKTKKITVEKQVTMINEFTVLDGGNQVWRRTSTVTTADKQARTMFLEGRVQKIDQKKIHLTIDHSSCDGIDKKIYFDTAPNADGVREMFYQRSGNYLSLRVKPFPAPVVVENKGGISGIFTSMIASVVTVAIQGVMQGMVEGMTEMMVNIFTLGLVRDQLKDGSGDFTAMSKTQQAEGLSYGIIGCFMTKNGQEPEFIATKQQVLNW